MIDVRLIRTSWIESARCRTPEAAGVSFDWPDSSAMERDRAIEICAVCPVATECLEAADREEAGVITPAGLATIRGGLMPRERVQRRRGLGLWASGVAPQPSRAEIADARQQDEYWAAERRRRDALVLRRRARLARRRAHDRVRDGAARLRLGLVYTAEQTIAMTGATNRQLRYWEQLGLVAPRIQASGGVAGKPRLFARSDLDVIGRVLAWVRQGHRPSDFPDDQQATVAVAGKE